MMRPRTTRLRHPVVVLALALALVGVASAVLADVDQALARCAADPDPTARAACYQAVGNAYGTATESPEGGAGAASQFLRELFGSRSLEDLDAQGGGSWRTHAAPSPMDDSRSVYLTLDAEEPVKPGTVFARKPTLVIRFHEGATHLYFAYGTLLGSDIDTGPHPLALRFDSARPVEDAWMRSTDRKSLGLWRRDAVVAFVDRLVRAERLTVRTDDSRGMPLTAVFPVAGLDRVIAPLARACGWSRYAGRAPGR